eukprot:scaffold33273_cov31-Tisochrysis_lutea.AAC.1
MVCPRYLTCSCSSRLTIINVLYFVTRSQELLAERRLRKELASARVGIQPPVVFPELLAYLCVVCGRAPRIVVWGVPVACDV